MDQTSKGRSARPLRNGRRKNAPFCTKEKTFIPGGRGEGGPEKGRREEKTDFEEIKKAPPSKG